MTDSVLTIAERQTARGRCVVCGAALDHRLAYRVAIIARPPGVSGGYMQFRTPHKVCGDHAESASLSVDLVARATEQALLRARVEVSHGWVGAALSATVEPCDG